MASATQRLSAEEHSMGLFSTYGPGMARWRASITRSMWRYASRRGGRRVRPRQSSTARASRARKKGALLDPQGFDAGKKITGRKRHILVDTFGLLLSVAVHPANIQDRDGVALVLNRRTRRLFPFIERIYGDGLSRAESRRLRPRPVTGQSRSSNACPPPLDSKSYLNVGSSNAPFAWLSRFRRLARDFERYARTVAAFIHLAMIRVMLKRLVASSSS
jgi:transposase